MFVQKWYFCLLNIIAIFGSICILNLLINLHAFFFFYLLKFCYLSLVSLSQTMRRQRTEVVVELRKVVLSHKKLVRFCAFLFFSFLFCLLEVFHQVYWLTLGSIKLCNYNVRNKHHGSCCHEGNNQHGGGIQPCYNSEVDCFPAVACLKVSHSS